MARVAVLPQDVPAIISAVWCARMPSSLGIALEGFEQVLPLDSLVLSHGAKDCVQRSNPQLAMYRHGKALMGRCFGRVETSSLGQDLVAHQVQANGGRLLRLVKVVGRDSLPNIAT